MLAAPTCTRKQSANMSTGTIRALLVNNQRIHSEILLHTTEDERVLIFYIPQRHSRGFGLDPSYVYIERHFLRINTTFTTCAS